MNDTLNEKENDPITVSTLKQILNNFFTEKLAFLEQIMEENRVLKSEVGDLKAQIEGLELRLDDQAAYENRNALIVHNIPLRENEDPIGIARQIGDIIGVKISKNDIDAAHRMPSRKETPPFILKFISRVTRAEVMRNAKLKKPMANEFGGDPSRKIIYADYLTSRNRRIWAKARELWDGYYVWTKNGFVMCRAKLENARSFRIKSESEIDILLNASSDKQQVYDRKKRNVEETSPIPQINVSKKGTGNTNRHGLDKFRYQSNAKK